MRACGWLFYEPRELDECQLAHEYIIAPRNIHFWMAIEPACRLHGGLIICALATYHLAIFVKLREIECEGGNRVGLWYGPPLRSLASSQ
jgi:hypothetical protein